MFKTTALAVTFAMVAGSAAFAADTHGKTPTNPWIDCGIGAMIFPETPVGAVISNVIWDYGLTATTSMAVSPTTCEGKRWQTAMFINTNYPQLAAETAIGDGKNLAALGALLGCDVKAQADLTARVRNEMPALLARPGFDALSDSWKAEGYFQIVDKVVRTDMNGRCNQA